MLLPPHICVLSPVQALLQLLSRTILLSMGLWWPHQHSLPGKVETLCFHVYLNFFLRFLSCHCWHQSSQSRPDCRGHCTSPESVSGCLAPLRWASSWWLDQSNTQGIQLLEIIQIDKKTCMQYVLLASISAVSQQSLSVSARYYLELN